jgi:hypothetical protein
MQNSLAGNVNQCRLHDSIYPEDGNLQTRVRHQFVQNIQIVGTQHIIVLTKINHGPFLTLETKAW